MQRPLFHDLNLLTILVMNSHNQKMDQGHYTAFLVPHREMPDFINWLNTSATTWRPLPCTEWTKENYTNQLWKLANQDFKESQGIVQFVPVYIEDDREVMLGKLTWNLLQNYPWSEHTWPGKTL
jgi:hypothetical protein